MDIRLLSIIALFAAFSAVCTIEMDSPDVRILKEIAAALWEDRHEYLEETIYELFYSEAEADDFRESLAVVLDDLEPEEQASCVNCMTAVGTIQGFINNGFTFDEIRDQAVVICYGVTAQIGYNGTIMCPGLIDNWGPHVYYVLNVTDMSTREICEFHKYCGDSMSYGDMIKPEIESHRPEPVDRTRALCERENCLRIAHITDVHFDDKYSPGSATECDLPLCCRDYWEGTGIANVWGDYHCGVPTHTAEILLEKLAEMQPHIVMQTGDSPPHALWEESQMGQIGYSRWVAEAIERIIPGVAAYTCIGNHDNYPTNLYFDERAQSRAIAGNITEMYYSLSNWTAESVETMEIGGYYLMQALPGLKIMAINSNYGTTDNYYGVLLPDSNGWLQQTEYIENAFIEARERGDKIILLGHHTIGNGFTFYVDWINRMLETYGDTIVFQLQGHSHEDKFQLSSDENLEATSVMFSTSTMGTRTNKNPGIRIYYVDPDTFIPVEYDHYYLDLAAAIELPEGEEPEVVLMYNTREDYGMADLSLDSLEDFINRTITDDELYYKYIWNRSTGTEEPNECDGNCRIRFACDMRTSSDERYQQCLDEQGIF